MGAKLGGAPESKMALSGHFLFHNASLGPVQRLVLSLLALRSLLHFEADL